MSDQMNLPTPPRKKRIVRSYALAGTALALVLGGAVIGSSVDIARTTPAFADAVHVQNAGPASFADVVDKVRAAVVSVRVKSMAMDTSAGGEDTPFGLSP